MTFSPSMYLELARARQGELLREAEREALRKSAPRRARTGLLARLAAVLRRRPTRRAPAPAA
ncbi:MAG TPA: hypothetical protein VFR63_00180 [Gaiellaceae bacterium]|nr:hypothetical protein [Gaiellaceae bacterium]